MPRKPGIRSLAGLTLLLLAALGLRLWGIGWGLPHAGRFYPYHPDESVLLHAVCSINPLWQDFAPSFYNYGTLSILLSRLAFDLSAPFLGWGSVPRYDLPFAEWVDDFARLLLVGRIVTVLLGTATVLVAYHLASRLYGRRAGWLAAAFLAVAPMPVLLGHYMTVDIPAVFFMMLSVLFSACALRRSEDRGAVRWAAAAGLAAGLAAGTKYNAGVALLPIGVPLWAVFRRSAPGGRRDALAGAAAALALCGLGFLVSTPGALLEPQLFWSHLFYELELNRTGQALIFRATPPAALYHLGVSLPVGLEWPLFLLSLAGLAYSFRMRRPEDALLWLLVIPAFLLLAPAERKYVRYAAPLLPPLVILAARLVETGLSARTRRAPGAWAAAAGLAGAAALASTTAHLGVLSAPDSRDQAAQYLRERSGPSDLVALAGDAWFYTPPVHPSAGCVKVAQPYGGPPVWERLEPGQERLRLARLAPERDGGLPFPGLDASILAPASLPPAGVLPAAALERYRPDRLVMSDFEYVDSERVRRADPAYSDGMLELLAALERDYRLEREFRPRPAAAGLAWWRSGTPPLDWRYFMPVVRIYQRKER